MTMKELCRCTPEQLAKYSYEMARRGNMRALGLISYVEEFYNKRVKVVKGRKVPKGTEGTCFWMGSYDNSKYGDPWGIYTNVRIGIKDDAGEVYWTSVENVEVMQEA